MRTLALISCSVLVPVVLAAQAAKYQLTGRVVMRDGTPVPSLAGVELICNGRLRTRGKPYTNGDFNLLVGDDSNEMPDVTAPGDPFAGQKVPFDPRPGSRISGTDEARFESGSCELRAVLPGYESNVIALGPRRRIEKSEVGTLVLHRPGEDAVAMVEVGAPSAALKAFDTARTYLGKPTPEYTKAAIELEKATKAHPTFAAAWNLLGVVRLALGQPGAARTAFTTAISSNPKYVEPYVYLARLEAQQQRWSDAAKWVSQAQQINPSLIDANYLAALVNFQLGNFEAAEKAAEEVLKRPESGLYPQTFFIFGTISTQRGDLESAAVYLRRFLESKPDPETAASVAKMLDEWERDGRLKKTR
jgi:tetratricopeptide (TPR) repeat protein